ncbi:hypothetical protein PHSY_000665 [Pseudozyma hubeiensis SY62]|uniref:Uncharacterized protein n=1 Tax=Pseudozyma hubeiensis (strain SY62) TaxID=1305764 RepID=R9NWV0_PSEHS|nr:hypothetical protein PHSY_000665 [Pseudozyma hubeiensis SY62]GAC93103.1 hypothetical protein PHSY_000665 [Pseudozyma hubeiensis SY62]
MIVIKGTRTVRYAQSLLTSFEGTDGDLPSSVDRTLDDADQPKRAQSDRTNERTVPRSSRHSMRHRGFSSAIAHIMQR